MQIKDCLPDGAGTCRNELLIEGLENQRDHYRELLQKSQARAIELETQLVPLQQQFDDWAEQNRRAEDRANKVGSEYVRASEHVAGLAKRVEELEENIADAVADAERFKADNARLRAALEAVEWVHNSKEESVCAWCGGADPYPEPERDLYDSNEDFEDAMEEWRKWTGHAPDCQRQQALERKP